MLSISDLAQTWCREFLIRSRRLASEPATTALFQPQGAVNSAGVVNMVAWKSDSMSDDRALFKIEIAFPPSPLTEKGNDVKSIHGALII